MDDLAPVNDVFPADPIVKAVRLGQSVAVQLSPGQSLSPADVAAAIDISESRFLVAGKPHDLVSFADQISAGAALDGKAGRDEAFRVLTTVDAKCKSIVLVITGANTLSSEATLQFLANAMVMQRRLSLVLIGQGGLDDIVMCPMLAPVRKRFVLLSQQLAPETPADTAADATPAPATMHVVQTLPTGAAGNTRRRPPFVPIAAGAGAVAVLGLAVLLWPKSAAQPRPVDHVAANAPAASAPPSGTVPPNDAAALAAHVPPAGQAPVLKPQPPKPAAAAASLAAVTPVAASAIALIPASAGAPSPASVAILPQKVIALPVQPPAMVKVPGGSFRMGSALDRSEAPVHLVTVPAFAIAAHAVTVQMWAACVQAGACKPAGQGSPDTPVTNVSWDDANQYAAWLSNASGARYRLPTEAEWEYAARAGSAARYAWGDTMLDGKVTCADCNVAVHGIHPPETTAYPANKFGLTGMGGGVEEWVQDCWHKNYEGAPAAAPKAWDAPGCSVRVLRGGSWENKAADIRTASRDSYDASVRYPTHGFRLVRTETSVPPKPMPGKS